MANLQTRVTDAPLDHSKSKLAVNRRLNKALKRQCFMDDANAVQSAAIDWCVIFLETKSSPDIVDAPYFIVQLAMDSLTVSVAQAVIAQAARRRKAFIGC